MKRINLILLFASLLFAFSSHAAEKIYFVHTDHLGTPQALTDDAQTVVWKVGDHPFGDSSPATQVVVNNIRFPGQYFDSETGLHYNWNRYYDPESGRYVTSDPIGLDGGLNSFGYVFGNPLRYSDPTGEVAFISGVIVFVAVCLGGYTIYDGFESCEKKFPRHSEQLHPDYRAHLICISTVAGIVGLGTGIAVDPMGGAIEGVIDGANCEGDQCE